jgi:hypothetical protein
VVHKPEGMVAQVITDVPVDYKVETSTNYYDEILQGSQEQAGQGTRAGEGCAVVAGTFVPRFYLVP